MKSNILSDHLPVAPAVFIGVQEGFREQAPIALFNLTRNVGEFRDGTTVSAATLLGLGFSLPEMITDADRRRHAWRATRRSFCSFNAEAAS